MVYLLYENLCKLDHDQKKSMSVDLSQSTTIVMKKKKKKKEKKKVSGPPKCSSLNPYHTENMYRSILWRISHVLPITRT